MTYYCTFCRRRHYRDSGVGREHQMFLGEEPEEMGSSIMESCISEVGGVARLWEAGYITIQEAKEIVRPIIKDYKPRIQREILERKLKCSTG